MKTNIVIFVQGGVVQEVRSTSKDIEVDLVDFDNLEAEGKGRDERIKIGDKAVERHPYVIF